jgi:hypothetical protein
MHHESDDGFFVFPSELSTNLFGEANEDDIHSLPQVNVKENHVFDKGKKIYILMASSHLCIVRLGFPCFP